MVRVDSLGELLWLLVTLEEELLSAVAIELQEVWVEVC